MAKLADLIEESRELLASIDAWDNGKCRVLTAARSLSDAYPGFRQAIYSSIERRSP
jgi:acyl-CoA reductase-like NAD-dependent aldehyde dehydrogenase